MISAVDLSEKTTLGRCLEGLNVQAGSPEETDLKLAKLFLSREFPAAYTTGNGATNTGYSLLKTAGLYGSAKGFDRNALQIATFGVSMIQSGGNSEVIQDRESVEVLREVMKTLVANAQNGALGQDFNTLGASLEKVISTIQASAGLAGAIAPKA